MATEAFPTREDLEAAWRAAPPAPQGQGHVRVICVRLGDGVHECPERVLVTRDRGVDGDRWATGKGPSLAAQVTLMNVRVTELIVRNGVPLDTPGDNFQVDLDLAEDLLPPLGRIRIGEALLEASEAPHTGCKKFRERFGLEALTWVNDNRPLRLRGMNCRVLEAGWVAVGDSVAVES